MKTISIALQSHLSSDVTTVCTCWKIVRGDGLVLGFTDHDLPFTYDDGQGHGEIEYKASSGFLRSAISNSGTLAPDELEVNGWLDSESILEDELRAGLFDYAEVFLFLVNYEDLSMGDLKLRYGRFGEVQQHSNGSFTIELRGLVQQLQQTVGRTYIPDCDADLGDKRCGIKLIPDVRKSRTRYKAGERVRVRNSITDKTFDLQIVNGDFENQEITEVEQWTFQGIALSRNNANIGNLEGKTTAWEGKFEQMIVFSEWFGATLMDGATGQFTTARRSEGLYQHSRLYLEFFDAGDVSLGTSYTEYTQSPGSPAAMSLNFTVPAGSTKMLARVQFRKFSNKNHPPQLPFNANYDCTRFDNSAMYVKPVGYSSQVQVLKDPAFQANAPVSLAVEGWRWGTLGNPTLFITAEPQRDMLFSKDGGLMLLSNAGNVSAGVRQVEHVDLLTLVPGGGLTEASDIDTGEYEIEFTWDQANSDLYGAANMGCVFYAANGTTVVQSVLGAIYETRPVRQWQLKRRRIPIPVGARWVRPIAMIGHNSSDSFVPIAVALDNIKGVVAHRDLLTYGFDEYGGVEYQALNEGVSGSETPFDWSRTINATLMDGSIQWQVVFPTYTFTVEVTEVISRGKFKVTPISKPVNFFRWGVVKFVSGANVGFARECISWEPVYNAVALVLPVPFEINVGDKVVMHAGCDKKRQTCSGSFNNILNFRGFPDVPGTDQYFKVGNPGSK